MPGAGLAAEMVRTTQTGQMEQGYSGRRRQVSLVLLVLVNILPLAGVVFLDWDVLALMILYWSEYLVLGFYTVARMLLKSPLGGLGYGMFFGIHYGGFCAVHGLFILVLLAGVDFNPFEGETWPLFLVFIQLLVNVIKAVLAMAPPAWLAAFAALFISHGASFVMNFILAGEKEQVTLKALMNAPYKRIVVLHVAVIAGGGAVIALGQTIGMLLVLVCLKLALDITLHLREHRPQQVPTG